jgi:hypothetical protein
MTSLKTINKSQLIFRIFPLFILIFIFYTANGERGVVVTSKTDELRQALVIGNASYQTSPLRNPENDATDLAAVLKERGFKVKLLTNASESEMGREIKKFGKALKKGGVGLFFFAGHGIQVNGVNYLIPVDAKIEEEDEIEFEAIDSNLVLKKMNSAGNRLNMVFLDACRNNPFARSFRSTSKGLAPMDAPRGTLVSFATAPGKTAADGTGRNGLFTSKLLDYIKMPNLELTQMMKRVRAEVRQESMNKQVPWGVSSMEGDFFFNIQKTTPMIAQTSGQKDNNILPVNLNEEEILWKTIENSKFPEDFEIYLENYPEGRFATVAKIKIMRLGRMQDSKKQTNQKNKIESKSFREFEFNCNDLTQLEEQTIAILAKKAALNWPENSCREIFTKLQSLRALDLSYTPIRDIAPLINLQNLTSLNLKGTKIRNISVINNLNNLQKLDLSETRVTNLNSLSSLSQLQEL